MNEDLRRDIRNYYANALIDFLIAIAFSMLSTWILKTGTDEGNLQNLTVFCLLIAVATATAAIIHCIWNLRKAKELERKL